MPRKQKKYHYIYKTTCQVTGKFYIGMHSTDDLDDGYLGSGKILGYSLAKHGKENHKREILEMLPTREALKLREQELVNEELLLNPLNMNLKYGGDGGSHGKEHEAWQRDGFKDRVKLLQSDGLKRKWKDPDYANAQSARLKLLWQDPEYRAAMKNTTSFLGKQHSDAAKKRIGEKNAKSQSGTLNSQFGTCWVTKEGKPIKINKHDLDDYLQLGYCRGRK